LRNRESVLTEFQNLLTRRKYDAGFKEAFVTLLVNLDQMRTPEYQQKIDYNTDITFKLLMEISRMLNSAQHAYLLKRIGSLAADLDKLSCDPVKIKLKGHKGK
jgi:hypothetical protein